MALLAAGLLMLGAMQSDDLQQWADAAAVDVVDLAGAVNSTGLDPRAYLIMVGHLPAPRPPAPPLDAATERRLNCISRFESNGYAGATNPRSGAAGEFQFLWSTWRGTPQGRAGLSPYDPVAARQAARWMLAQGRAREWVPVQLGLC